MVLGALAAGIFDISTLNVERREMGGRGDDRFRRLIG